MTYQPEAHETSEPAGYVFVKADLVTKGKLPKGTLWGPYKVSRVMDNKTSEISYKIYHDEDGEPTCPPFSCACPPHGFNCFFVRCDVQGNVLADQKRPGNER